MKDNIMDHKRDDTGDSGPVRFETVHEAERAVIDEQRKLRLASAEAPQSDANRYSGISISGGGIRSASFALGILQALNAQKVLPKIDYLSTVSGGGYIGSSWTWFNYLKRLGKLGDTGEDYFFPFGVCDEGARSNNLSIQSSILSYLRQHANYLVPGFGLNYFSGFAVVFRNMLLPLLVYISMAVVLFTGIIAAEVQLTKIEFSFLTQLPTDAVARHWLLIDPALSSEIERINLSLLLVIVSAGLLALAGLAYGPVSFVFARTTQAGYRIRTWFQRVMGAFVVSIITFTFIGSLPFFITTFEDTMPTTLSGFVGVAGGLWHFIQQSKRKAGGIPTKMVAVISSLCVIVAMAAFSYYLALDHHPDAWKLALPVMVLAGLRQQMPP